MIRLNRLTGLLRLEVLSVHGRTEESLNRRMHVVVSKYKIFERLYNHNVYEENTI